MRPPAARLARPRRRGRRAALGGVAHDPTWLEATGALFAEVSFAAQGEDAHAQLAAALERVAQGGPASARPARAAGAGPR